MTPAFDVRYAHVDAKRIVKRIIRNPNYGGGATVVPGACLIPLKERDIKPQFFEALRKNVERDGFRNPVLVYCTPEGILLAFGGSRVRVAKELDMDVPAIIVDYDGEFFDCPLVTPQNCRDFFRDPPELFRFTDCGIDTHYSLERNRREWYDEAGMAWAHELDETEQGFLDEEFPWLEE